MSIINQELIFSCSYFNFNLSLYSYLTFYLINKLKILVKQYFVVITFLVVNEDLFNYNFIKRYLSF